MKINIAILGQALLPKNLISHKFDKSDKIHHESRSTEVDEE